MVLMLIVGYGGSVIESSLSLSYLGSDQSYTRVPRQPASCPVEYVSPTRRSIPTSPTLHVLYLHHTVNRAIAHDATRIVGTLVVHVTTVVPSGTQSSQHIVRSQSSHLILRPSRRPSATTISPFLLSHLSQNQDHPKCLCRPPHDPRYAAGLPRRRRRSAFHAVGSLQDAQDREQLVPACPPRLIRAHGRSASPSPSRGTPQRYPSRPRHRTELHHWSTHLPEPRRQDAQHPRREPSVLGS